MIFFIRKALRRLGCTFGVHTFDHLLVSRTLYIGMHGPFSVTVCGTCHNLLYLTDDRTEARYRSYGQWREDMRA